MDPATSAYYAEHAAEVARRYEQVPSPLAGYFATAFAAGSRVLDVGCGSGRDLTALRAAGFDAFGVEPVDALRAQAFHLHPELDGRIAAGALPAVGAPFGGNFDGVLCSAVLMHLPQAELFDAAFALRSLLRPHGRLLVSVPLSRGETLQHDRDANGRLFTPLVPEALQLLFERIGLQLLGRWDSGDALQRDGTRWSTLLFELRAAGSLRAADQIEGILNRDRKVATYKLALFRALAEIEMQEPHAVHWRAGGVVAVPLQRIAERWLLYYWPIIAAGHVPQSQDEGAGSRNPLRFRASLTALIDAYRHAGEYGGLSAWHVDRMAGRMTAEVRAPCCPCCWRALPPSAPPHWHGRSIWTAESTIASGAARRCGTWSLWPRRSTAPSRTACPRRTCWRRAALKSSARGRLRDAPCRTHSIVTPARCSGIASAVASRGCGTCLTYSANPLKSPRCSAVLPAGNHEAASVRQLDAIPGDWSSAKTPARHPGCCARARGKRPASGRFSGTEMALHAAESVRTRLQSISHETVESGRM